MAGVDTRTRYQGVYARHRLGCAKEAGVRCNCAPSYYGVVWDRTVSRHRKTARFHSAAEARDAREDLQEKLRLGTETGGSAIRFDKAREEFVEAAREGVALNKWGRSYRRRAVADLESALRRVPEALSRRPLRDIRRGDIQRLVDELTVEGLSGSRVRSVVNATRSLYRWAQDRELAGHDPASGIRLPAMNAKPRDRVATPAEFADLLNALSQATPEESEAGKDRDPEVALAEMLPWALAGYATARRQEIRVLDWSHVDLDVGAIELAADEDGRKPGGSWRIVPIVRPLADLLKRAWIAAGRPKSGKVCPPLHSGSRSKLLAIDHMQEKVHKRWSALGLKPIGLHEARHTAATWLDHAGVSPKVASQIMGHKTPEYQPGAAPITLRRYTHTLPGELERARQQLDAFLLERS